MINQKSGPTFQQWVGTYECTSAFQGDFFSPLELKSDGTLTIGGQKVEYSFIDAIDGKFSISLSQFTLTKGGKTLTAPRGNITFRHEDGRAIFDGRIQASSSSGYQGYNGKQSRLEIVIPNFYSDIKISTAIYNGHLHVVGAASIDIYRTHLIVHRKFPLNRLIPQKGDKKKWTGTALANRNYWSKELWQPEYWKRLYRTGKVESEDFEGAKTIPKANSVDVLHWASSPRDESGAVTNADITSLVSIGNVLYCFYTYSDSGLMSLRARKFTAEKGNKVGLWGSEITLHEPLDEQGNDHLLYHTGAVSVVPFGRTQILVAACGTGDERTGGAGGPGYGKLMFYLFDISDTSNAADGKGWAALSRRWIDVNTDVDFYLHDKLWKLGNRCGAGYAIDVDWIVTTKPGKDPKTLEPEYSLAISFGISSSDNNQHGNFTWQSRIPLEIDKATADSDGKGMLTNDPWGKGRITAFTNQTGINSSMKKDASGRLQSFTSFTQKQFAPLYTRTDKTPSANNEWGNKYATDKIDYYGTDDHTKPSNIFHTYLSGQTKVKTPGINLDKKPTMFEGIEIPILEFICYGKDKIQLHEYGSIRMVSDNMQIKQNDTAKPVYQIGGYFDGPVPFPLQNFAGVKNLTGGSAKVAVFEYGNSSKTITASSTESTWNIGMESEGKTTNGIGVGFKLSYEYEDLTKDEKKISSKRESYVNIKAWVLKSESSKKPKPKGTGAATPLSAQFYVSGFQFVNRWGAIISDGLSDNPAQSPKLGRVLTRMQPAADRSLVSFKPALVTPGDLESYTAEKIDAKMAQKYGAQNYVRDTICKNAYVFGGGQPYLMYTWDHGSMSVEKSNEMTNSFVSHEWSHGGQAYAGLTGGVELNIFGLGEDYEFSVMAGGGYKREWSKDSLKEAAWTIGAKASEFYTPMPLTLEEGGDPDGVVEYAFRAYFLPVPSEPSKCDANKWAKELRDMLPEKPSEDFHFTKDQVDTGFGCWRIFFLITSITYREGSSKKDYTLPADLDNVVSVYANQE